MNNELMLMQLEEMQFHLEAFIKQLKSGPMADDEEVSVIVDFGHILEHMNLAWHYRKMSLEDWAAQSQDRFEELCDAIPNYFNFKLVGPFEIGKNNNVQTENET
jgi:hypothetical protein